MTNKDFIAYDPTAEAEKIAEQKVRAVIASKALDAWASKQACKKAPLGPMYFILLLLLVLGALTGVAVSPATAEMMVTNIVNVVL